MFPVVMMYFNNSDDDDITITFVNNSNGNKYACIEHFTDGILEALTR